MSPNSRGRHAAPRGWLRPSTPQPGDRDDPESRSRRIVVGYDGSPASRAAVAQAGHRAGDEGRVYVVHAYALPANSIGATNHQHLVDLQLEHARARVERLEEEAGPDLQGVDWEVELIGDRPARAIASVAAARQADEIVVGTRGFGRARALLGSVAHEVIHLAECRLIDRVARNC